MKDLEKNKVKLLLDIINPNPSQHIVHFAERETVLTDILSQFCLQKEYFYQLHCTDPAFYGEISEKFKDHKLLSTSNFNLKRPSYMIQGKTYNYAFVTGKIPQEYQSDFLKKVHKILLNAANIIIFIPKKDHTRRYHWIELLEEHFYVATNTIDDLFAHYDIIISKKMHGWGK